MSKKQHEPIDRTELEWDIEDARFEMMRTGTPSQVMDRKKRCAGRAFYLASLRENIKLAIKYGK